MTRRVVCAAIRKDRLIIAGARHYDSVMRAAIKSMNRPDLFKAEQGFIDQWGVFLSREEALSIARNAGQIEADSAKMLFSEDLY